MPKKNDEIWKDLFKAIAIGIGIGAGAAYIGESASKEPVHVRFRWADEPLVKQIFVDRGFQVLSIFSEVKKIHQLWGVSQKIDEDRELHVRAIKDQADTFYLSGHVEAKRDSLKHLLGKSDYELGKQQLTDFLKKQGLWNRQVK